MPEFGRSLLSITFISRSRLRAIVASAAILLLGFVAGISVRREVARAAANSDTLASSAIRSAMDFNWKQSPAASLAVGKNSVNLESCPPGVNADEPWYYVYIAGSGTPEAVKVTGGTCKGDGRAGTLEFSTQYAHAAGYSIGSASGGIQEASIAARYAPTNPKRPQMSGRVVIPPGEYDVFAPISIRASNQTLDFSGAVLNCYTANDACVFVGDRKTTSFVNITLIGPRGRPMIVGGTKPFIEVNGEETRIFNVTTGWPPKGGSFGSYVQVDDDQAFLLDGLDTSIGGGGVTCNPTFCGAAISAPGPFNHWSAVGWLKNLNLSLQCDGKGVEWLSGNGLKISDSVIQGWSVFGIRASNQRGGYAGLMTDNVYFEASPGCKDYNPYGNVGSAAIIAEGVQVKVAGLNANSPAGSLPNWGAAKGSHTWLYWVVPVHAKFGDGVPLPAGRALTDGAATITGTFPKVAGASSYKILKIDWDGGSIPRPYPQGTGNYLLTTIAQSSCATLACSFTDNGGKLSLYSNAGEDFSTHMYMPRLDFWPGGIVLSPAEDVSTETYQAPAVPLQADVVAIGGLVTTQPAWAVTAQSNAIMGSPASPPAAANVEALHTNAIGPFPGATVLESSNLPQLSRTGRKGRLNFGHPGRASEFTPIITLADSNWGKTWSSPGHRPAADVKDLDLGYEGSSDTLYNRAEKEIREYVNKFPDGSPQEKLTASAKTFNVPVTIHGDLTVTGKCSGCSGSSVGGNSAGSTPKWSVSLAGQKSAIASTSLCGSSACTAGQYRISYYLDSNAACASPGDSAASLLLSWKDETGAKKIHVPLTGLGIVKGESLQLGAAANFGGGEISVWSAGAGITYSTDYRSCTAGGGTYALRIAAEKVQ